MKQTITRRGPKFGLIACSAGMREVVTLATRTAALDFPVAIRGEPGVGKKLLARLIHSRSKRADRPFLGISCAGLRDSPPNEGLLGREQTAGQRDSGLRRLTQSIDRGTLFLDAVEQLPMWAQVQLLEMAEASWMPAPWAASASADDVRVIATTATDLEAAVTKGRFSRRLYDHLNLTPITVPPLRERQEDIKPLATYFLKQLAAHQRLKIGNRPLTIPNRRDSQPGGVGQLSKGLWDLLDRYHWPGNVRELAMVMTRIFLLGEASVINRLEREQPQREPEAAAGETISVPMAGDLKVMECHLIREVVRRHGGNKAAAARALGMHRRTLYRVLENGKPPARGDTHRQTEVGCRR